MTYWSRGVCFYYVWWTVISVLLSSSSSTTESLFKSWPSFCFGQLQGYDQFEVSLDLLRFLAPTEKIITSFSNDVPVIAWIIPLSKHISTKYYIFSSNHAMNFIVDIINTICKNYGTCHFANSLFPLIGIKV